MDADEPSNTSVDQIVAWCRAAEGPDDHARRQLGRVLEAYRPAIYNKCLAMTGDRARAEDLCQDTMVTAMRRLPDFRGDSRFRTWIFGIAINVCRNANRKYHDLLTEDGVLEATSMERTIVNELSRAEREALMRDVRESVLTAEEQRVIYLRYDLQLSRRQIDETMNLTGSGSRAVIQRCQNRMRTELRSRLADMGHGTSFIRSST